MLLAKAFREVPGAEYPKTVNCGFKRYKVIKLAEYCYGHLSFSDHSASQQHTDEGDNSDFYNDDDNGNPAWNDYDFWTMDTDSKKGANAVFDLKKWSHSEKLLKRENSAIKRAEKRKRDEPAERDENCPAKKDENEPDMRFGRNDENELGRRSERDEHASGAWRMTKMEKHASGAWRMTKMEKTRIRRMAHDGILRKRPVLSASFFSEIILDFRLYHLQLEIYFDLFAGIL